ncbi:N-6 DNA methylase [Vibrio chagasii]|nr:N-6 DNA methylase [Vibrio chagasii]
MITKLLEQLQKDADQQGIRLQAAFSRFVDEMYQQVLDENLATERSAIYLELVAQYPFQDILGMVAVEIGRMDFKRGQFMTPFECAYTLARMQQMNEPEMLDPTCGTGVMGLVKLALMREKIVKPTSGFVSLADWGFDVSIHLNDLDSEMTKISTIQVFTNWAIHCQIWFELDLLVTQNNFITDWDAPLNKVYQSEESNQNFNSLSCAKKKNILMNPPYGLKDYGFTYAKANAQQSRFSVGVPNKGDCEYAFILSGFDLLKDDESKAFMILPNSVTYKASTQKYRSYFTKEKSLIAIIALPRKVFAETDIPTTVFMFDKAKKHRDNGIYIMNLDQAA